MIEGAYLDRVWSSDGRLIADHGWRSNTIVLHAWTLIAGLLRGEPGLHGVQYCAVGQGSASWDTLRPKANAGETSYGMRQRERTRVAMSGAVRLQRALGAVEWENPLPYMRGERVSALGTRRPDLAAMNLLPMEHCGANSYANWVQSRITRLTTTASNRSDLPASAPDDSGGKP